MREIKFRAWDKIEKRFSYVTLHPNSISFPSAERLERNNYKDEYFVFFNIEGWKQFTGLKDKNGNDVWEGDIMESCNNPKVKFTIGFGWNTDKNCYGWTMQGSKKIYTLDKSVHKMEVIGNIYENPELLEVK